MALASMLIACSTSKPSPAGVSPTRDVDPADAVAGSTARDQALYLQGVRLQAAYHGYTDRELIAFADLACSYLAGGADAIWTAQEIEPDVTAAGGQDADVTTIMAAAVVNLCPAYLNAVHGK